MAVAWRQNSGFYQKYLFHLLSFYKNRADVKVYLELILSLLTIIVFILLAIRPTLSTIAALSAEVSAKAQLAAALDQKIQAISTAQQTYQQNIDKIQVLNQSIPSQAEVTSYIKQIEGLAAQYSLQLSNIQMVNISLIGAPVESVVSTTNSQNPPKLLPEGASGIASTFSISGEYQNLLQFLADIENARRPIALDTVASDSLQSEALTSIQLTIIGRLPYLYSLGQVEQANGEEQ